MNLCIKIKSLYCVYKNLGLGIEDLDELSGVEWYENTRQILVYYFINPNFKI